MEVGQASANAQTFALVLEAKTDNLVFWEFLDFWLNSSFPKRTFRHFTRDPTDESSKFYPCK